MFTVRFDGLDQIGNARFSVSKKSEDADEKQTYKDLKRYHKKLAKKYSTFLPIYCDDAKGFATLRLKKKYDLPTFKQRCVYSIDCDVKSVKRDGKVYVNCWHTQSMLLKEAKPIDYGEKVDLDSDSDCGIEPSDLDSE